MNCSVSLRRSEESTSDSCKELQEYSRIEPSPSPPGHKFCKLIDFHDIEMDQISRELTFSLIENYLSGQFYSEPVRNILRLDSSASNFGTIIRSREEFFRISNEKLRNTQTEFWTAIPELKKFGDSQI